MADRIKYRARMSSSVDPDLWAAIQDLSIRTRIPQSRLIDEAFEDLLKKYGESDKK